MRFIYCLVISEEQVKELLSDALASLGCSISPIGYGTIYQYKLLQENNLVKVEGIIKLINDVDCESGYVRKILSTDNETLEDLIAGYKKHNMDFLYYSLNSDIIANLIRKELSSVKIKHLPKSSSNIQYVKFAGELDKNLKCLIVFGKSQINLSLEQKLFETGDIQRDLNSLYASKIKLGL